MKTFKKIWKRYNSVYLRRFENNFIFQTIFKKEAIFEQAVRVFPLNLATNLKYVPSSKIQRHLSSRD